MKSTQFVCHNSFQRVVNFKKNIRALVVLSVDWVNDTPLIIYTSFSVLTSKQGWTYLIYCLQPNNFSHQLPYKNTLNSLRSNICNGQEIHIPNFFFNRDDCHEFYACNNTWTYSTKRLHSYVRFNQIPNVYLCSGSLRSSLHCHLDTDNYHVLLYNGVIL